MFPIFSMNYFIDNPIINIEFFSNPIYTTWDELQTVVEEL